MLYRVQFQNFLLTYYEFGTYPPPFPDFPVSAGTLVLIKIFALGNVVRLGVDTFFGPVPSPIPNVSTDIFNSPLLDKIFENLRVPTSLVHSHISHLEFFLVPSQSLVHIYSNCQYMTVILEILSENLE